VVCLGNLAPNYRIPSERLTKHFVFAYLNSNKPTVLESIFAPAIKNWYEEFPVDVIPYPLEMADATMKSLNEVYHSVRDKLKPTPSKPQYVFNMKDYARVAQGIQLVASKSKVKPKFSRKG
jgi:dynein heavy chain